MKRLLAIAAVSLVFALLSCLEARAQRRVVIPEGTDINTVLEGGYLRPVTGDEQRQLNLILASDCSAALFGLGTVACGMGAIIYHHEALKIADSDWYGFGKKDAEVSRFFLGCTIGCVAMAAASGASSLWLRKKLGKTTIRTTAGSFVIEF